MVHVKQSNVKNIILNLHRPILESYYSLTEIVSADRNRFPNLKENAEPSDFEGLLKDKKYQNVLVDRMLQTSILINIAENYLQLTQVCIDM